MTSEECNSRAVMCVANAALAPTEEGSTEFLKLAAQWRAMASRQIFLGHLDGPLGQFNHLSPLVAHAGRLLK